MLELSWFILSVVVVVIFVVLCDLLHKMIFFIKQIRIATRLRKKIDFDEEELKFIASLEVREPNLKIARKFIKMHKDDNLAEDYYLCLLQLLKHYPSSINDKIKTSNLTVKDKVKVLLY